jgi:hypothetical protein
VKAQIERQKAKYGWEFIFLGSNIDAVETASRVGIAANRALNCFADSEGMHAQFRAVHSAVSNYRGNSCIDESNFQAIRDDAKRRGRRRQ